MLADVAGFVEGKDTLIQYLVDEQKCNRTRLKRKAGKKNVGRKKKDVEDPNDGVDAQAKSVSEEVDDDDFEKSGGLLKMLKKLKKSG